VAATSSSRCNAYTQPLPAEAWWTVHILEAGGGGFGPPRWASGGMDTLPHNGAVITLLAVTGLTHR
jgi:hypothetical protein